MEMNRKKKRLIILSVLAVVVLAAGILGGREVWLYEHPEIQINFSHDRSENLYRSYPICSIRSRSRVGQGYAPRYDEDAGTEVTYGDAYILQRRIDGEWQDAETVIEDYGFTAIGHTVACGEEVSNYYKWDWLDGVLEPGEYRKERDFLLDRWVGRL